MEQQAEEPGSILVVDDNPLIVKVLKSLLASVGYSVYTSTNGGEALDVLKQRCIDVIICDVMMPSMGGYELHESIRKVSDYAHIPFIFLTALGSHDEVSRGKETGADDYIVKPFDAKDLLATVKGKVSRSRKLRSVADERYDAYRKRVVHTLSHEFRTPLVAINTGTELLMEQELSDREKTHRLLEAVRRGGQRLERLVNDFMLLQQIEAGVAQRLYDTRAAVRPVSELVQLFLEGQSKHIECLPPCNLRNECNGSKIFVYEPHIHDILGRLMSNAVKFKLDDPLVDLRLRCENEQVLIEVSDRGRGIDPARAREAIDLFGQIDRDKLEQQGGGLGLAIASRYASINRGELRFERRVGGGTVVSLVFPAHEGEAH